MGVFIDLTGQSFRGLVVLAHSGKGEDKRPVWRCQCTCGEVMESVPTRAVHAFRRCRHVLFGGATCTQCERSDVSFYPDARNRFHHKPVCIECFNQKRNSRRVTLRNDIIHHYGTGSCAVCGETEFSKLSLDHINGGGYRQMKDHGLVGASLYSWLRTNGYPEGYQILCMRCNMAKGKSTTEELKAWILQAAAHLHNVS